MTVIEGDGVISIDLTSVSEADIDALGDSPLAHALRRALAANASDAIADHDSTI
jgi:hypothetical protein